MRVLGSFALLTLLVACGGDVPTRATEAERTMKPGHAPTPFSAAEIRAACPHGRMDVFRVPAAEGQSTLMTWRFMDPDEEGVTVETYRAVEGGPKIGEPSQRRERWEALQQHASFPADAVEVRERDVTVAAGTFACWTYRVSSAQSDGSPLTQEFDFAKERAGPPIRVAKLDGDTVTVLMELLQHQAGDAK